ncbi:MAG: hypothetical protein KAX13_00700 [Candidatus Krumholzibacteria bacterium]|nr:hypothetical protein [Candidatus Krumholzibacteria bacterium]
MRSAVILILLVALAIPCSLGAQTMVTMTTAAVSAEGEGGLFMIAGNDVVRGGVLSRFLLSKTIDLGLQLAFDRYKEKSFLGFGVDFKFHIPAVTSTVPIDIAIDAGAGLLESSDRRRIFLAPGIIVSGRVETSKRNVLVPYMGLYALFTRRTWKIQNCDDEYGRGCQAWEKSFYAEAMLRAGVMIPLREDFQILVEMNVNGEIMFGAGVNVIF